MSRTLPARLTVVSATALLVPSLFGQGTASLPACLENSIETKMDLGNLPGLAASIVRDGEVLWAGGFGSANLDLGLAATADTPFFMASISKTVTAVCLMQLREQGLLELDDDINDYLSFPVENPNHPGVPITFRHLLTHTSGLRDNWTIMDPLYQPGDSAFALSTFLPDYLVPGGAFYDAGANFYTWAPGSTYQYCNQAVSLVGLLVEVIAGQDFAEYAKDNVFTPLGMTNSSFRLADFDPDTIAMPYQWNAGTASYIPIGHYGYPDYPAGTMRSSVLDLMVFQQMIMEDGTYEGTQILTAASVQEMRTVQYPAINPQQGLVYYYNELFGNLTIGHDGGDPGVLSDMYYRPSDGIGVIIVANSEGGFAQYYEIYQWLFSFAESLATETVREGTPPNPTAFQPGLTSGPVVGATWDPVIDHATFMPASVLDFVAIGVTPTDIPTGLGTVLCGLNPPIVVTGTPGAPFAIALTEDCNHVGVSLCTQGGGVDALLNIELTNALDITIGTF